MPKSILIEPQEVLASGSIHFSDIPVNVYRRTIAQELEIYSAADLLAIWQDMCAIREFETILQEIKTKGACQGFAYQHAGPAHLSIGQEAAAVGMAFSLTPDDHIFGSHRSHGEILAKGFSAIRQLSDEQLLGNHGSGIAMARCFVPVEKGYRAACRAWRSASSCTAPTARFSRARRASIADWAARCTRSSRRSASIPITPSWAARGPSRRARRCIKGSIASRESWSCNIGDASFGCGPVWEGITFSAMDQYRQLWDASLGGGLPIVFNCMNNFYGMGGQPLGETMGVQFIARIGAGVNPEQMHAERVNGYDPLPVIDAFRRKKQVLAEGRGPVLLDTVTYRFSGHSPSDASSYRSKEEIERWQQADSIPAFRQK